MPRLNDYKAFLEAAGLSATTVTAYERLTLEFTAWLKAEKITALSVSNTDITAYLHYLQKKGQANITRNMHLLVVRHYFDYLIQQGERSDNPARHLKIRGSKHKKLYPILKREELDRLHHEYSLPEADDSRANRNWFTNFVLSRQRNKSILGLMVHQGLSTPEIGRLTVKDMPLREGTIYIAGSRKSAERTLELKPQQIIELMEYLTQTRQQLLQYCTVPTERLFIAAPATGKNKVIRPDTVNIWKRLTEELHTQQPRFINFKQVRTSVITHWLGQYNLRQVQYMAGHKYVSTTETYLMGQVEDLKADIGQFHPIG